MRNAIFSGLTPLEMENSPSVLEKRSEEGGKTLAYFDRSIETGLIL
jgi:hypothetical protein